LLTHIYPRHSGDIGRPVHAKGIRDYIRSDNRPQFVTKKLKDRLPKAGVKTTYIEPGNPWENGYDENFNGKFRYDLPDEEIFDTFGRQG
jgi:putative transposase